MPTYNVVVNTTLKEYWIAEPKYSKQLDSIIERFHGKFKIIYYPTSNVVEDINTEQYRGYTKADHYLDWDLK